MIGINRIETRNSINHKVASELNIRIKDFEQDTSVDVGVLYGVGGSFCSGYDLNVVQQDGFTGFLNNEVIECSGFVFVPIGNSTDGDDIF